MNNLTIYYHDDADFKASCLEHAMRYIATTSETFADEWLMTERIEEQNKMTPEEILKMVDNASVHADPALPHDADSDYKLEEEIDEWCAEHFTSAFSGKAFNLILRWLNRKAELTRKKKEKDWQMAASGPIYEANAERDRMRAKVDELNAQVEELERENACLKARCETVGELYGEIHGDKSELQAAYDKLTSIAAELCRACGFSMVDASGEVIS